MKRRSFINQSAIGITGAAIASSSVVSFLASCDRTGKEIRMALIGCSIEGISLVTNAFRNIQNVSIKYVFDFDMEKAGQASQMVQNLLGYLPGQVPDMEIIFNDTEINGVFIFLPEHWRAMATIRACKAGKDVYVESLPIHSILEGRQMLAAAKKYKRIIQAGFNNRSALYAISAREYTKSGRLGQVMHVKAYSFNSDNKWMLIPDSEIPSGLDWNEWIGPAPEHPYNSGIYSREQTNGWNNYWAYSSGILGANATHAIDLARMILNDPDHPKSVYCFGGNWVWKSQREVPEFQSVTYGFDKFTMTCECGYAGGYMKQPVKYSTDEHKFPEWMKISERVEVYGTAGLMYIGCNGEGWQVISAEGKVEAEEYGLKSDILHQKNFIECIRNREKPNSSMEQAYMSSTLVHLGNISHRVGNKLLLFDKVTEKLTNSADANMLLKTSYREGYTIPDKK